MEFHQIKYFLAAADKLNFTRAAEQCAVSQPSLTRAIKSLEDEFGGPLFRREGRHTHLTDLGRELKWRFAVIQNQTRQVEIAAREMLNLERGTLKLGIMRAVNPRRILKFIAAFKKIYPKIKVDFREIRDVTMTDELLNGELDAAFYGVPTALHERFDRMPLYEERVVLVFPAGHEFSNLKKVPWNRIHGQTYLIRPHCEFSYLFSMVVERGIKLETDYSTDRDDWILEMVRAGLGISLIPEYSINIDGVDWRPVYQPEMVRSVDLVTVSGRRHKPALRHFIDSAKTLDWKN